MGCAQSAEEPASDRRSSRRRSSSRKKNRGSKNRNNNNKAANNRPGTSSAANPPERSINATDPNSDAMVPAAEAPTVAAEAVQSSSTRDSLRNNTGVSRDGSTSGQPTGTTPNGQQQPPRRASLASATETHTRRGSAIRQGGGNAVSNPSNNAVNNNPTTTPTSGTPHLAGSRSGSASQSNNKHPPTDPAAGSSESHRESAASGKSGGGADAARRRSLRRGGSLAANTAGGTPASGAPSHSPMLLGTNASSPSAYSGAAGIGGGGATVTAEGPKDPRVDLWMMDMFEETAGESRIMATNLTLENIAAEGYRPIPLDHAEAYDNCTSDCSCNALSDGRDDQMRRRSELLNNPLSGFR